MLKPRLLALVAAAVLAVGCDSGPKAPSSYVEVAHEVTATALDAYAEARIVPKDPSPAGVRKALQEAAEAYWQTCPVGSHGKPITRFQAWAYRSAEAYEKGEAPLGSCDRMGESAALEVNVK